MSLTLCNCVLKISDQLGNPYSTVELISEPRKTQVNSGDAVYLSKIQRASAQAGVVIQDLLYLAASTVTGSVTVAYTGGGTAGAEVVTVTGNAISVQIQSGVSTANQIRSAIIASVSASALVTCIVSGTGSTAQTTVSATTLSNEYCYLKLAETTTNSVQIVFRLNWDDGSNYGSIIFDPAVIPAQSYLDLSTLLTVSRG